MINIKDAKYLSGFKLELSCEINDYQKNSKQSIQKVAVHHNRRQKMKKIFSYFLLMFIILFFGGCFKKVPLAYMYEDYQKKDGYSYFRTAIEKKRDEIEVQKALLECGFQSPLGDSTNDSNKIALMDRCMEKAGFMDTWELNYTGGKTYCDRHPNLPACQLPLSAIPDRNITMRLTSKWCQHYIYKTYPECQIDTPITLPPPKHQDKTIYKDNTSWKLQQQIQKMNNDAMDKMLLKARR